MERRIFLAVIISLALLWSWAAIAPKFFPSLGHPVKPATDTASTPATATTSTAPAPGGTTSQAPAPVAAPASVGTLAQSVIAAHATPVVAETASVTTVDTPEFIAQFSNRGAEMISFRLKHYKAKSPQHDLVELVKARDPHRADFPFAIEAMDANLARRLNTALYQVNDRVERSTRVLEFRYVGPDGVGATKTFRIGSEFLFNFAVSVTPAVRYRVVIGPGIRTLDPEEKDTQIVITGNGVVQRDASLKVLRREKSDRVNVFENVDFVGVEDNYFLSVLRPEKAAGAVLHAAHFTVDKEKRREFYAGLTADADGVVRGSAFFGPKSTKTLDQYGFQKTLQFGFFDFIARLFLIALVWINQATHNYGFAIIVLTILIKIALYPLQHKSIVSMRRMQKLQPKTEAIKAKYKKSRTDPEQRQKMNMEVMQLYQKEGINPMGGCIPIVLQLPILWGFYGLLSRAIELRGAPFILWIHDLSSKDPYYVLPLIMVVTMFIQQYITPSTVDPAQRRMFLMMPIVFGFFFKEFPSGLVLYWLVQNVLTIVQQLIMNKWWENHPDNVDKEKEKLPRTRG
jgi:YidC/Oxa1 family membrane protein insertase